MITSRELHEEIKTFIETDWVVPEAMRDELSYIILHIADELMAYKSKHKEPYNKLDIIREACIRGLYTYVFYQKGYALKKGRISVESLFPLGVDVISYPDWLTLFFRSVGRVEEEIAYIEKMLELGLYQKKGIAEAADYMPSFAKKFNDIDSLDEIRDDIKDWVLDEWGDSSCPGTWQESVLEELFARLEVIFQNGYYVSGTDGFMELNQDTVVPIVGECTIRSLYDLMLAANGDYELTGEKIHIRSNVPCGYEMWNNFSWYTEFLWAAGQVENVIYYFMSMVSEKILENYGEIRRIDNDFVFENGLTDEEQEYAKIWLNEQDYNFTVFELSDEDNDRIVNEVYAVFFDMIDKVSQQVKLPKLHFRVLAEAMGNTILAMCLHVINSDLTFEELMEYIAQSVKPFDGFDVYLTTGNRCTYILEDFVERYNEIKEIIEREGYQEQVDMNATVQNLLCTFFSDKEAKYLSKPRFDCRGKRFHFVYDETIKRYEEDYFSFEDDERTYTDYDEENIPVTANTLTYLWSDRFPSIIIDPGAYHEDESIFSEHNEAILRQWITEEWRLPRYYEERFFEVFNHLVRDVINVEENAKSVRDLLQFGCLGPLLVHALYYVVLEDNDMLLVKSLDSWIDEFWIAYRYPGRLANHIEIMTKWQVWQSNQLAIPKVVISNEDPQDGKRMLVSYGQIGAYIPVIDSDEGYEAVLETRQLYESDLYMVVYNSTVFNAFKYESLEFVEDTYVDNPIPELMEFLEKEWGLPVDYHDDFEPLFKEEVLRIKEETELEFNHLMVVGVAAIKALYQMVFNERDMSMTGMMAWRPVDWVHKYVRATGLVQKEIEQMHILLDWGIYQGAGLVINKDYTNVVK